MIASKFVRLRRLLDEGSAVFGTFRCLPTYQTVDALASSGFDFVVFDVEHAPSNPSLVHAQIAVLARVPTAAVVRLPAHDAALVKQYLDLGVDALMVPNVETAEQAQEIVWLMRFPPAGVRGIGGSVRASDYFRDGSYYTRANDEVCLMAQIESPRGLENLEAICAVDGVDIIFFGPNDFAANSGLIGHPGHTDIVQKMVQGIVRAKAAGTVPGILCSETQVEIYRRAGAQIIAVGSEVGMLVRAADDLVKRLTASAGM
jgi:2-keto-3-deoxy-L-rhamnonate aldolase RhmA